MILSKRQLVLYLFPIILIAGFSQAQSSDRPRLPPFPGNPSDLDDDSDLDYEDKNYPRYSKTPQQQRRELENNKYLESFGQWWSHLIDDFPFQLVYTVAPKPVNIKLSWTLRPFKMFNLKGLMSYNCHDQVTQFQGSCDVERIGARITLIGGDEITLFKKIRFRKGA